MRLRPPSGYLPRRGRLIHETTRTQEGWLIHETTGLVVLKSDGQKQEAQIHSLLTFSYESTVALALALNEGFECPFPFTYALSLVSKGSQQCMLQ